jgi:hypothetical protein
MLFLAVTQAFAGQFCFDLIDSYAVENCITPPYSFEIDLGQGPVVSYRCDLGRGMFADEDFAVFSLDTDLATFFKDDPQSCDGGDVWINPGYEDDPQTGVSSSWLAWRSYRVSDDIIEEVGMTHFEMRLREQASIDFHFGELQE